MKYGIRLAMSAVFSVVMMGMATSSVQARELGMTQWVTPYGVKVLFLRAPEIPMVDLNVDIDGGSRWDAADKSGVAALTHGLLSKGVRAHDGLPALNETQISEGFAELAVQRGGSVGLDRASISLRMLSEPEVRQSAARLLARLLIAPSFDADVLDREKKRTIAAIQESMTQPQSMATKALWKAVFGPHPYGQQPTPESIAKIVRGDLEAFHARYWQPSRMRVTVVGALSQPEAQALVDTVFSFFPKTAAQPSSPLTNTPMPLQQSAPTRQAIEHPATQAHLWLGLQGISRSDPEFFALTVGNYILGGGGFVSRLTEEIREKRGLSYSVFSAFSPLAQPGPFMISLQTQSAQAPQALQVVEQTIATFLQAGPTDQELKAAKQNLVGGFALRVDTNRKMLDNLAQINYYDLPLDYLQQWTAKISAVTKQDIQRAMARVLKPQAMSVVVVAGPAGFKP